MKAIFFYSRLVKWEMRSPVVNTIDGIPFTEWHVVEDDAPNEPNNKWRDNALVGVIEGIKSNNIFDQMKELGPRVKFFG